MAWIGRPQGGLAWLHQQIGGFLADHSQLRLELHPEAWLDTSPAEWPLKLSQNRTQRIIIALENRVQLNPRLIERLQTLDTEIPLAVATDTWFDGSRRTGIGETGLLVLPWYRWWDGWRNWLAGSQSELFNSYVAPSEFLVGSLSDAAEPLRDQPSGARTASRGLVVSDSGQTGQAWCLIASRYGSHAKRLSSREFNAQLTSQAAQAPPADWILLDDSADICQFEQSSGPLDLVANCRATLPRTKIILACSMPRADQWLPLSLTGHCELLAKPTVGSSLHQILEHFSAIQRKTT